MIIGLGEIVETFCTFSWWAVTIYNEIHRNITRFSAHAEERFQYGTYGVMSEKDVECKNNLKNTKT
jgi:hypothetical protein